MNNRKIDMTELANYIRIRPPDKEKLAELLVRAKGASRSMRQFALDCGVNPSTLSRIVNMKTSGACTDELLQKVAQNSDTESGITFEILMDANGKVPRRMTGRNGHSDHEQAAAGDRGVAEAAAEHGLSHRVHQRHRVQHAGEDTPSWH